MNVEALTSLLNMLHFRNHTIPCPDDLIGSIHSVDFVYEGRVADEIVTVLLAIKFENYNKILLGAINGNLLDLAVVSSMYASGFGLPLDEEKAVTWSSFATLDPDTTQTYAEAVLALKEDRKKILETCLSEGVVIPNAINELAEKLAIRFKSKQYEGQELKKGAQIVPNLPGVQATLLYRTLEVDGTRTTRLYGVLVPEKDKLVFSRKLHQHFDVPNSLGEIRGRNTIPEYDLFGKTVKVYCVQGVLTTPLGLVEARNTQFPKHTTVRSLLEALVSDKLPNADAILTGCKAEVKAKLERKRAKLQATVRKTVKKSRNAELQAKIAKIDLSMADAAYIARCAEELAQPLLAKAYLHFVATELFVCSRGALKNAPIGTKTAIHLQSLGFRSFSHHMLDFVLHRVEKRVVLTESELDNVIDKFNKVYRDSYRITSVRIRPLSDSVNIHKPFSYKRSKER